MSAGKNLATGLTLREAFTKLVENDSVQAWREKCDEVDAFKSRVIAEYGPPSGEYSLLSRVIAEYGSPSGEYSLYDADGNRRRRQYDPLKSHEYLLLKEAEVAAGKAVMGQFCSGLAECRVLGSGPIKRFHRL